MILIFGLFRGGPLLCRLCKKPPGQIHGRECVTRNYLREKVTVDDCQQGDY